MTLAQHEQNKFSRERAFGVALLAAIAALGAVGCGALNTAPPKSANLSSYGGGSEEVVYTVDGGFAAECTSYAALHGSLSGKVSTFYPNGPSRGASEDSVRMMVTSVGTDVTASSNHFIKMFRWKSSGVAYLDPTPVQFQVVSPYDGRVFLGSRAQLSSSDIAQLASIAGLPSTATASDALSRFMFIIGNLDFQWQALKIVVYDSSGNRVHEADSLIPMFLANPSSYAAIKPGELARLHPFHSQRYDNSSDAEWAERARNNCF